MIFVYFLHKWSFGIYNHICVPVLQKWNKLWFAETLEVNMDLVVQARLRCMDHRHQLN